MSELRRIILTARYSRALDAIRAEDARADQYHRGLEWFLERCPTDQPFATRSPRIKVWPWHIEAKRYAVYMEIDDHQVILHDLRRVSMKDSPY